MCVSRGLVHGMGWCKPLRFQLVQVWILGAREPCVSGKSRAKIEQHRELAGDSYVSLKAQAAQPLLGTALR